MLQSIKKRLKIILVKHKQILKGTIKTVIIYNALKIKTNSYIKLLYEEKEEEDECVIGD